MRTIFDNYLELPKRSLDPSSSQLIKAISDLGASAQTQQEINYSSPSQAERQAESILKIQQTQQINKFSDLSKNITVVQNPGGASATIADRQSQRGLLEMMTQPGTSRLPANQTGGISENKTNELKVKLTSQQFNETVTFEVMPSITENRAASYEEFTPLHHPGDILKYRSTTARSWTISTKLISRNVEEATKNLNIINVIRSWVMPFYGLGTERDKTTNQFLGGPPPILTLSAYGKKMIGPVSCILENYSWEFPNNVDYLPAYPDGPNGAPSPFPVVLNISLNLKESISPAEYSGFDLVKYKNGDMPGAFTAVSMSEQKSASAYPAQPIPGSIANEPAAVAVDSASIYGTRE
jgi:hypothetical protein